MKLLTDRGFAEILNESLDKQRKFYQKKIEDLNFSFQKEVDRAVNKAIAEEAQFKALEQKTEEGLKELNNTYAHNLLEYNVSEAIRKEKGWLILGTDIGDVSRVQSVQELWNIQDAAYNKYHVDPHCASAVNNLQRYTIGRGIKFNVPYREAQKILESFWKVNKMERRQKRMVRAIAIEGEYFLIYFMNDDRIKVRRIPNKQISEIETHSEDLESKLSYGRQFLKGKEVKSKWYADVDYFDQDESDIDYEKSEHHGELNKDVMIQFIKVGSENEIRGRCPLYSVLRYLKLYEDLVLDGVIRWHELAKVIWIQTVRGKRSESSERQRRAPKGGVMLTESDSISYRTEAPRISAGDAEIIGKMLLYTIGSGVTEPIHILDQNAENENYASIRKSDTPFTQMIIDNQDFWSIEFELMFRVVLRWAVKINKLPDKVKIKSYHESTLVEVFDLVNQDVIEGLTREEIVGKYVNVLKEAEEEMEVRTIDLPINIIFPDVIYESPKEMAQVLQIHRDLGIVSQATLSERAGYNWRHELMRKVEEKERKKREEEDRLARFNQGRSTEFPEEEE